ncbi:MAG TPA: dienelactone hydrolase family protein [Candidatus Krumholzibacteria bacterium]
MKTVIATIGLLAALAAGAHAAVKIEPVEYSIDGVKLKGQIAYDDAVKDKRPGVIVVHQWWGLNEFARRRARMLAESGYVALAVDMFGEGKTTEHPDEAGKWASEVRAKQQTGIDRFMAGYNVLKQNPHVDASHISAIGYCFGGSVVLDVALAGIDLDAAISVHGGLPTDPVATKPKARILVCNGAADPMVTQEQIASFQKVATDAGADWEFISYAGAKHAFSDPDADKHGIPALAYNEKADRRSWATILDFLAESGK